MPRRYAKLTALEPDERFADSSAGLPRTEMVYARIEHTSFADGQFDVIHSCHTIEHLGEAFAALKDHARTLKPGGLLVIDAPNTALLGGEDIVEEWFIDKHLFHFSARTLSRMIEAAGLTVIEWNDPADAVNVLFVAKKTGQPHETIAADPAEVMQATALMARYQKTRARNLTALKEAARELTALSRARSRCGGAGRLFDLLVREGGFNPSILALLIDTQLQKHMHGAPWRDAVRRRGAGRCQGGCGGGDVAHVRR